MERYGGGNHINTIENSPVPSGLNSIIIKSNAVSTY